MEEFALVIGMNAATTNAASPIGNNQFPHTRIISSATEQLWRLSVTRAAARAAA